MAKCKERSGILFNHPCEEAATLGCTLCNKPICERHMRHYQDKPACMTCVRDTLKSHKARGTKMHDSYANDPYFFFFYDGSSWSEDPYDADDYDLFDSAPASEDFGAEGGWEGS